MPTLLGLPPSRVEMTIDQRGASYDIDYPKGGGALAWLRKLFLWPLTVRAAARELKDAHEALQTRYKELERRARRARRCRRRSSQSRTPSAS